MASGTQVGTAWVQVTPSFRGFGSSLTSSLTGDLTRAGTRAGGDAGDAAGRRFGDSFADAAGSAADRLTGIGTVAGVATAGAFGVGLASAMDAGSATARLTAQLRLTEEESARVGAVAGEVFSDGFGGSLGEVNDGVGAVISSVADLGSVSDAELAHMTTQALGLAEVYQWDVSDAAAAAGNLIKNGLAPDAEAAFDSMAQAAATFPASMRADIPNVVTEYGTHLARIGLDAQTSFGLMSQYVQAGGRDIDQAADVLHEFGRIAFEEGDRAADAFEAIGLDADAMLAAIHEGGPSATEALTQTLDALRNMEDPAEQSAQAVELFGDMAGESTDALWAMDPATAAAVTGMDDAAGAAGELTDALADDPARVFQSSVRGLTTSLASGLGPILQSVAGWAADNEGAVTALAVGIGAAAVAVASITAALRIYQGIMAAIRIATVIWTGVQWALNVAMYANPFGLVVLAVLALIAAIAAVIIYWDEIVAVVSAAWDAIVDGTQAAWDWLVGIVEDAWNWLVDLFQSVHPVGIITSHWETIRRATGEVWDSVKQRISDVWESITSGVRTSVDTVRTTVSGAWDRVRDTTSRAWESVRSSVVNGVLNAWRAVSGVWTWFKSIGTAIVGGIISGITSAASNLYNSLKNLASNALSSAKSFLGIGSPSRLFAHEVGQWIPAGVELGIDDGQGELDSRIEHMVRVPDPPTVRAAVATGIAAQAGPTVQIIPDGTAAGRALVEILQHAVRTQLGGDVNRLSDKKR
ncbi:phage tail tape measure protein [Streptomyces xiamenensis]|uniref:phage tail tape measure protein n=1 Tax=Streptomyces xiamenensis TaxID=408015 RepID=UPI0037D31493